MLGEILDRCRGEKTMVHCMVNLVTDNDCANVVLRPLWRRMRRKQFPTNLLTCAKNYGFYGMYLWICT